MPRATTPVSPARSAAGGNDEGAATLARIGARLAAARRAHGLTLAAAAARSGLSPAYVSQIETGAANPTVRALASLAAAVDSDLGQTMSADAARAAQPEPGAFSAYHGRAARALDASGVRGVWDRSADGARLLHARILHAEAGDHGAAVRHRGEEYVLVLRGTCTLHLGPDARTLNAGDSCHFAADQPHHLSAISGDLTLSVVMSEPGA